MVMKDRWARSPAACRPDTGNVVSTVGLMKYLTFDLAISRDDTLQK
jgi:hypothetical protein